MKNLTLRKGLLLATNFAIILLMFLALFRAGPAVYAAGLITLDGSFADWSGQAGIGDPAGDGINENTDITGFYFANNPGDPNLYFSVTRAGSGANKKFDVTYLLYIDTNNNGIFTDPGDVRVTVVYNPLPNGSQVSVSWPGGSASGDWGTSKQEGGLNVEWYIPFSVLGIPEGQPVQMMLTSLDGGTPSDQTGSVQWSPANALGWILLAVIWVAASIWMTVLTTRKIRLETASQDIP